MINCKHTYSRVRLALVFALSASACTAKSAAEQSMEDHGSNTNPNDPTSDQVEPSDDLLKTYAKREHFDEAPLPASKITGTDKNKNNIRDDIEKYIDETYGDTPRDWLIQRQYARAYQRLISDDDNKIATLDAIEDVFAANACAQALDEGAYRPKRKELEARIINTEDRLYAYMGAHGHAGGQVFSPPDASKTLCRFDTEGL